MSSGAPSIPIPGPSTPIIPSSRAPAPIPRTPSSTVPHPSTNPTTPSYPPPRKSSIYDRNLNRRMPEVSLNSFAFLFSELVQYLQKKSGAVQDLENQLNELGYHIGQRVVEMLTIKEGKSAKRETKLLGVLQFVHTTVWKSVFGRPADALEKSTDADDECKYNFIYLCNTF